VPNPYKVITGLLKSFEKGIFTAKTGFMRLILPALLSFVFNYTNAQDYYLLVGTYDSPKSEGIYVYSFNKRDGSAKEISHVKTANPSYLAVSPNQKYVYAVNENADSTGTGGGVTAFILNKKSGQLSQLNYQSSEGNHPCYITTDKTGKYVVAGNYSSGSLSILPVKPNGSLLKASQVFQHTGRSANEERQTGPHVHATVFSPDEKFLFVPDLGIDKIKVYTFHSGKLKPAINFDVSTGPGSGPRHFVFHPNGKFAYLVQEILGSVNAYSYRNGRLSVLQEGMSALPLTYNGPIGSADIHVSPDGKFLYVSNRGGSNSIAVFSINPSTGKLKIRNHQTTMGEKPRNFNFDPSGNFLLVGNQDNDEIVIFKRNKETGLLTDTGKRIKVGKPVCIKWIKAK
jgi:6-phosphogluconolactonase